MKCIITLILIVGYFTGSSAQIEVVRSDEVYLLGEVINKNPSIYDSSNVFVASLSYTKSKDRKLFALNYIGESGYKEKIEFYATDKDIDDLYNLILNDFSKPPGEFETIVKLGGKEIKIHVGLAKLEVMANTGYSFGELDFSMGRKHLFSLKKEELKELFNK